MDLFERWTIVTRFDRWPRPPWLQAWWKSSFRPLPFLIGAMGLLAARREHLAADPASPEAALAQALGARGLSCDAGDVVWLSGPSGVWGAMAGRARALVRAHVGDEPSDLYAVEARLSPQGAVIEAGDSFNLTETQGADESRPVVKGLLAVYTTWADGLCTGLHVLDLAGRPGDSFAGYTRLQRAQVALTNLQRTGTTGGIVDDTFLLDPVARHASFLWRDDASIELQADDRVIVIEPADRRVVSGGTFVRVLREEHARPGNVVTWAVDRFRAMPWFGDDRMQWVKAVAFTALDRWRARFAGGSTAQEVEDELGLPQDATSTAPSTVFADPEIGWPPPPMKTLASPPLPGEGQWIKLDHDAFITPTASGAGPAFVTSFVRPDVHRLDVRVYVTLWDPRQVALHIEAGAVEPVGPSGERGPGLVPRTPEVMRSLVAGFNGGFQAQHGEFGMKANGIEYLPPKPYAATLVELRDGSNGFGAWPGPGVDADASHDILAFRQNLTALVENGKYNPWGRNWWGGTPPGWADQIHSTRSAICLTREGFVGYFYSASISAEDLGQGMLAARCVFGIHLDMNPGHAGFEFYHIAPEGQMKSLGRPLQGDWEAEGKVPDMAGFAFRSRRMIRGMWHMLFPRYIQREARDFFYLTARPLLPGAPLPLPPDAGSSADPGEGVWRTKGLPQHGFPYAVATTWVRAEAGGLQASVRLRVLRADPRAMKPATASNVDDPTVLAFSGGTRGVRSLVWQNGLFAIEDSAPSVEKTVLVEGVPSNPAIRARAAVGLEDEDGMLVWVELPPDTPPSESLAAAMDAVLGRLGCSERMLVPGEARARLGGSLDLTGAADSGISATASPITSRLVRARAPDAHAIFESTPIVPFAVWQPLQAKRLRTYPKPASAAASAFSPPSVAAQSSESKQPR